MSLMQLAKYSFFNFSQLKEARKVGLGKIIGYLILLSFLSTIPLVTHVFQGMQEIRTDGQTIAEKIPPFRIQEGRLTTETSGEGFIYQTDSIIFTFDPDGQRTSEDISNDLMGNLFSIGLLPESIVIALPANDLTTSLLGSSQLELSYQENNLEQLDAPSLKEILSYNQMPWWIHLVVFLVALYPSFLSLLFTLLIGSIFTNIYCRIRMVPYSFLDNLKILAVSITLPVCLTTVVQFFTYSFDASTFILMASIFIFPQTVKKDQMKE